MLSVKKYVPVNDEELNFLEELYEKYYNFMKKFTIGFMHDQSDSDDVIQDSFVIFTRKAHQMRKYSPYQLHNYIVIVTRGQCLTHLKKKNKKIGSEQTIFNEEGAFIDIEDHKPAIEDQVLRKMDLEIAGQYLKNVSQPYLSAFLLKFEYGMSNQEIGETLDIQPQSVRIYVNRAIAEVCALAKKGGVFPEQS